MRDLSEDQIKSAIVDLRDAISRGLVVDSYFIPVSLLITKDEIFYVDDSNKTVQCLSTIDTRKHPAILGFTVKIISDSVRIERDIRDTLAKIRFHKHEVSTLESRLDTLQREKSSKEIKE